MLWAVWARMCEGTREDGNINAFNDLLRDTLMATAKRAKAESGVWLKMRNIYGNLVDQRRFHNAFSKWLIVIWERGVEAALESYCNHRAEQPYEVTQR